MKIFIWIATIIVGTLINTLIGYAFGIRAGSVLLYIAVYFVAQNLCKKWDENHRVKETTKETVSSNQIKQADNQTMANVEMSNRQISAGSDNNTPIRTISYCRRCGFKLVSGSGFCSNCGTKIEKESDV